MTIQLARDRKDTRSNRLCAITMACALAGFIGGMGAVSVQAQRYVMVNGQLLNEAQIRGLEQLACAPIPSGSYWLQANGLWGYVGDPRPRGKVGEYCNRRRPSLSERGLLYYPGELLR
jgi:hypothetical protein